METEQRAQRLVLTDSRSLPGGVVLNEARDGGKLYGVVVMSRDELQAVVQQALDVYGIVADPFATPGSLEAVPA